MIRAHGKVLAVAFGACLLATPTCVDGQKVEFVVGGDIEWDFEGRKRPQNIYLQPVEGGRAIPLFLTPERRAYLDEHQPGSLRPPPEQRPDYIRYNLTFDSEEEAARYPFRRIRHLFLEADLAYANLESALADHARRAYDNALVSPSYFANGIEWAGIDIVSVANNHGLDGEGAGLLEGIEHLKRVGVASIGGGGDLEAAREPFFIERNGLTFAFLAYAHFINPGQRPSGFAAPDNPGIAPLDPNLVREDIQRVRHQVDYVVLSLDWSESGDDHSSTIREPHEFERRLAHDFLDAGADIILGHHPPIPRGIEIYRGKVIFYSLAKLIFTANHPQWSDNIMGRITLTKDRIERVEIIPMAGEGLDLAQPYPLEGKRAIELLEAIRDRSAALGTNLVIEGNTGIIRP